MIRPLPPTIRLIARWTTLLALHALLGATASSAQSGAPVADRVELTTVPDASNSIWSKIGAGAAFVIDGALVVNDNINGEFVAFQGLLGQLQAEHVVELRASMKVWSNIGGQAVVIEISRPGLEMLVQLRPNRVDIVEREGGRLRFVASAAATLDEFSEVVVRKESRTVDSRETFSVFVNGALVAEAHGIGRGELGVGRVVFGSLGYESVGASEWDWIEVDAELIQVGTEVPVAAQSFGRFKQDYILN